MPDHRADEGPRGDARDLRLGELGLELRGVARERRIDDPVEREVGRIGHDREHVVELDRVLAARVQRELADLAARGAGGRRRAAAPARRAPRARSSARRRASPRRSGGEVAVGVGIAGQRRGILALLAQRRAAARCACRSPASITTRQSGDGAASSASTAAAKLRPPALTQTARRPPNSGMVCASSTRRAGSPASSSPSSRASANGSCGSSTEALDQRSTRSRTRPASGPNTSTIGRAGIGPGDEWSTSAALRATMTAPMPHRDDALRCRRRNTTRAAT